MNRYRDILKWTALSIAFVVGNALDGGAFAQEPLVVGVISPLTGVMATVGVHSTAAIQWWAQSVNAAGGINGRKVELDVCDDQGNPEIAVTCAHRHMDRRVALILDNSVSSTVRGITPLLMDGPVMIVSSPIVNPDPKSYVFQTSPTDLEITRALLAYLQENHVTKLAMIGATDTTGEANVMNAQAVFPPAGIELSLARIDLKANDASIQLARIVKDNPILYSAYSGTGAATVVKSFSNLGLTVPFIISNANLTDAFMALIKDDMPPRLLGLGQNVLVPEFVENPDERARIERFKTSFSAWRNEPVSLLTLQGLILADVAAAVLANADALTSPAKTKLFLETTPINSIAAVRFSHERHIGMGPDTVSVMEYKNNRWTKADPL